MDDFIFIRQNSCHVKVLFSDIQYAEAKGKYIHIVTKAKQYITRLPLHQFISMIASHGSNFCRIHKSYIISLQQLISFDNKAVIVAGSKLPIGRQYKHIFLNRLTFFISKTNQRVHGSVGNNERPIIIDINQKSEAEYSGA